MKRLPYPDNLWIKVFDDTQPVPPDASETLDFLLAADERAAVHRVIDLYFKQDKSLAEIAEEMGKSRSRIQGIINEAAREMRHRKRNGVTLQYGLEANEKLAEGKAAICQICGKLIEEDSPTYVVAGDEFSISLYKPVQRICCSETCAQSSIAADINQHEASIKGLATMIGDHALSIQRLRKQQPDPISLKDALLQQNVGNDHKEASNEP